VNYAHLNSTVVQGADSGFIKFGSRVDVFLPLNAELKVSLNDKVKGGESVIAQLE
jgi:phosphatidylserine decarboxylase